VLAGQYVAAFTGQSRTTARWPSCRCGNPGLIISAVDFRKNGFYTPCARQVALRGFKYKGKDIHLTRTELDDFQEHSLWRQFGVMRPYNANTGLR
jgi:hypothetical protein